MKHYSFLPFILLLASNVISAAEMHELKIVKQVYDINTDAPDKMY